jgi:hypothetical protein
MEDKNFAKGGLGDFEYDPDNKPKGGNALPQPQVFAGDHRQNNNAGLLFEEEKSDALNFTEPAQRSSVKHFEYKSSDDKPNMKVGK